MPFMGSIIIATRRKKIKFKKIKRHNNPRAIHPPIHQKVECKHKKPVIVRILEREQKGKEDIITKKKGENIVLTNKNYMVVTYRLCHVLKHHPFAKN